jgi:hypothetical protein
LAAPALAAVRASHRHELLAAKGDDAGAAVARFDPNHNAIDEHEGYFP